MFEYLARLADSHAKRVLIAGAAFFLIAGALGGSVANRLAPYGADDPATETVKATNQLEDAGYRSTSLVVLLKDAKVSTAATRQRVVLPGNSLQPKATRGRITQSPPRSHCSGDGR